MPVCTMASKWTLEQWLTIYNNYQNVNEDLLYV